MAPQDTGGDGDTGFDPTALVSRKPSSLPSIYEFVYWDAPTSPKTIRRNLDVSTSVTNAALSKLLDLSLIERVDVGSYRPGSIALVPSAVRDLGRLRSDLQYRICRATATIGSIDAGGLSRHLGSTRSNVRAAAVALAREGFLERRWAPFDRSPMAYRVSETGRRMLESIDVDPHLDREGTSVVPHPSGIDGTEFRTSYEVEDARFIERADGAPITPDVVSSELGKDAKKTVDRLDSMAERGLVDATPVREKMVFEPGDVAISLDRHLALFEISRRYGLDFYSIGTDRGLSMKTTIPELYSRLVRMGYSPETTDLHAAKAELKAAGLLIGNSVAGYRFSSG